MKKFSNVEYSRLISNLIDEANYMDISNRSKMARLRDIAEILVRKMLNIGNDTQVMLGEFKLNCSNKKVVRWLSNIDRNLQKSFTDIIEKINKLTRNAHHTQEIHDYTDADVSLVEEYILDLYSMLFIQFFIDIKIDIYTEPEILTRFEILFPHNCITAISYSKSAQELIPDVLAEGNFEQREISLCYNLYGNLGMYYFFNKDFESARKYLEKAMQICQKYKIPVEEYVTLLNNLQLVSTVEVNGRKAIELNRE